MKIVTLKSYIFLVFLFFFLHSWTSAQSHPPITVPYECSTIMNSGSSLQNSTCTATFTNNYDAAPIINVHVNVHVWNTTENLPTATLVNRVRQMIAACNETLDNMQQNYQTNPPTTLAPRVEDAKFRLKLYSETTNTADVHGGIWVYPTLMFPRTTPITNLQPNSTSFPGYLRRYTNVVDIFLANYGAYQISVNGQLQWIANSTGYVYGAGSNIAVMADLNGAFQADALNSTTNQSGLIWRSVARALNHEIAHILSLEHSFECNGFNNCTDIDVARECGSRCSTHSVCGGVNNQTNCPGTTTSICRYGASWNIMAYDWWVHTITRCQWERVYNYAINTNFAPVRDCATSTTLTLPTSPLPDYRASQQITSTSVINAGRDVTYQSQLIRLNAGFRVALGAAFLASPSTFPCCDTPPASIVSSEEKSLALGSNDISTENFQIYPNPFSNELKIIFADDGAFVGQNETTVELINVNGKVVHFSRIKLPGEITINTKGLAPGIYVIRFSGLNLRQIHHIIKI